MPVFSLPDIPAFPHPLEREGDGLLAFGGSLTVDWLLTAYHWGIFPWYDEEPKMWWWTAPRMVLFPSSLHISHSIRNKINRGVFKVTTNTCFKEVISACASVKRNGQSGGTWIQDDIIESYTALHEAGYAHSIEVFDVSSNELVGGLYGVGIGKIFFGESMFARQADASKVGFVSLVKYLASKGIVCIDCQQETPHMKNFGAEMISDTEWLKILRENIRKEMFVKLELPPLLS